MNSPRRLAIVIPAVAVGLALGSSIALARPPGTVAGCGNGYKVMAVQTVIDTIAHPDFVQALRDADVNQDGNLCIKLIPNDGGPKQFDPAFLFLDNHV